MSSLYRAQILLETEQHEALAKIAQQEKRSISELVRESVRQYLADRDRAAQKRRDLQAIEELAQIRNQVLKERGVLYTDLLAEARTEREEDMDRVLRGGT